MAREGEDADLMLLQTGVEVMLESDEWSAVQTGPVPLLDDAFHQALRDMQASLEEVTEDIAAIRAQKLGRRLGAWRVTPLGPESHGHNRVAQMGAVLAAFEPGKLVPETDACDDAMRARKEKEQLSQESNRRKKSATRSGVPRSTRTGRTGP